MSSFRDPSGFLFYREGQMRRQINKVYKENYEQLMNGGLYRALLDEKLLLAHEEIDIKGALTQEAYKVIKPEALAFISYPYEWCFSQLKEAALTTLRIQKRALDFGMSLKDCSAYNIQFKAGRPVLIDTLSFERYREGRPWAAYRQFCQHFLAPLALICYTDIRLSQLLRIYIDGVPLDLAGELLPLSSRFKFSLFSHIHLQARAQKHFADKSINKDAHKMNRLGFAGLVDNLESAVKKLKWQPKVTEWSDYYTDTNYSAQAIQHKKQLVSEFLGQIKPKSLWDAGANVGLFSRIAADKGIETVSFDIDPACVEKNYLDCLKEGRTNILPLLCDLTNPSPAIGWENQERFSLIERAGADALMALALVHHLAISNNLPFNRIAQFFSRMCNWLLIEFIPKDDSQIRRMLSTREDIFGNYRQEVFEAEFKKYFAIQAAQGIRDSRRTLYLMRSKIRK